MPANFTRLVRFEDPQGQVHYGEAGSDWKKDLHGQKIPTYDISSPFDSEYRSSGLEIEVAKVTLQDRIYEISLLIS